MTRELDHIIAKFPCHRAKFIELFHSNDDFRALCDDYWQCNSNLARLRLEMVRDTRTENSYQMLSLDLEQEALRFLG